MTTARMDDGSGYALERTEHGLLLRLDDRVMGTLDWRLSDDALHIDHVHVDPASRGQGLGARLVAAAAAEARASGRRVVPVCGYAARVLRTTTP